MQKQLAFGLQRRDRRERRCKLPTYQQRVSNMDIESLEGLDCCISDFFCRVFKQFDDLQANDLAWAQEPPLQQHTTYVAKNVVFHRIK